MFTNAFSANAVLWFTAEISSGQGKDRVCTYKFFNQFSFNHLLHLWNKMKAWCEMESPWPVVGPWPDALGRAIRQAWALEKRSSVGSRTGSHIRDPYRGVSDYLRSGDKGFSDYLRSSDRGFSDYPSSRGASVPSYRSYHSVPSYRYHTDVSSYRYQHGKWASGNRSG